jgi:hypothetical protein
MDRKVTFQGGVEEQRTASYKAIADECDQEDTIVVITEAIADSTNGK